MNDPGGLAVLVTGATTPLGRTLVKTLLGDPGIRQVLAVGREAIAWTASPKLSYLQVDLTRRRSLHHLLFGPARAQAIDAVLHGPLHRSPNDPSPWTHQLDVEATRELLHLIEDHPTIRRLVYRGTAAVYRVDALAPDLLGEEQALDLDPRAPQWLRDRVEADLSVCTRVGSSSLAITVLRCAEVLLPGSGSQLYDYLSSRVCLRPLGYDPMLNLASGADVARACGLALAAGASGVFNIPGADTLPLSRVIARAGRIDLPLPGPIIGPLYRLRRLASGAQFRYDLYRSRFHFIGLLDGRRAAQLLGYVPLERIDWARLRPSA